MTNLQLADLKTKADALRRQLAEADRLTGRTAERERDATRKRARRETEKIVTIPRCVDPARRLELESDDARWLRYYFGDCGYYTDAVFWYDFVQNQRRMIDAIAQAIVEGGDQAIADARGGGKTTIARRVLLKYALQGVLRFPVLFSATGSMAEDSLQAIKHDLECNDKLTADYPEICVPIRALEDTPNRAHYMVARGDRHDTGEPFEMARVRFTWSGQQVRLPNVPGAPAARAIVATRGLDAAIVGLNKLGARPDLALIDDADTEESVYSEQQADKLEERIDRSIGGLGSQQKPVPRVMLCTIRNRNCAAWRFTDAQRKPSFRGLRLRFLESPPKNTELWTEYVNLVQEDWRKKSTTAETLYLANREAMDLGASVANGHRHAPTEHSALQHYYNLIARLGKEAVDTEYDNNPPEPDEDAQRIVLTAHHIQTNCLSGLEKRIVPQGTIAITIGADVQKLGLHYVAIAWNERGVGCFVDYDFFEFQTQGKHAKDCELLILEGLFAWHAALEEHPFTNSDGEPIFHDLALIDMGWKEESWNTQPVQAFCAQVGFQRFMPSKGASPYHRPSAGARHVIPGDQWHVAWLRMPGRRDGEPSLYVPVAEVNTDHWKLKVHEGFLAERGEPGSLSLFMPPRVDGRTHKTAHLSFAHHIVSETWETRFTPGFKGARTGWWKSPKPNHYFDSAYQAVGARSLLGISVLPPTENPAPTAPQRETPIVAQPRNSYSRNRW